jgi:hypothetical protein
MKRKSSEKIVKVGVMAADLNRSNKQVGRYCANGIIRRAFRVNGQWRAPWNEEICKDTQSRILNSTCNGKGLSVELKDAIEPLLAAGKVSGELVEEYLLAGVMQRAYEGRVGVTMEEACHYRWVFRCCQIEGDPEMAMDRMAATDEVFSGLHPSMGWLDDIRRWLPESKVNNPRGGTIKWLRGMVAFALATVKEEGELSAEIKAEAEKRLSVMPLQVYKTVTKRLCAMYTRKRMNAMRWLAEMPLGRAREFTIRKFVPPKSILRLSKLAAGCWFELMPPKPKHGDGKAPSICSEGGEGRRIVWNWASDEEREKFGGEWETVEHEYFGWKWSSAEERERTFRREYSEADYDTLRTQAARLLGLVPMVDGIGRDLVAEENGSESVNYINASHGHKKTPDRSKSADRKDEAEGFLGEYGDEF